MNRELAALLPRLIDPDTIAIILFGSAAHGRVGAKSDLDLLVVRDDSRSPSARVDELYRRLQPAIAVDLLVFTPQELSEAEKFSGFIRQILHKGKVLYERGQPMDRAGAAGPVGR